MQGKQLDSIPVPQAEPPRTPRRLFPLVAALLIAALLVGSTLWVLSRQAHLSPGSSNSLLAHTLTPRGTHDLAPLPDLYNFTSQGFYALDSSTGKLLWSTSSVRAGHVALVRGKTVYVDDGSTLYAFDAQHGTLRWHYAYGGHPADAYNTDSKLLMGEHGLYLVKGTDVFASAGPQYFQGNSSLPPIIPSPSTLFSFDPDTGHMLWQYSLGYRLNDPVIDGDVIYGIGSTTLHGVLYALQGGDGSVLWQHPLAQTSTLYYGFVAVSGTLYFASTSNTASPQLFLYAYTLQTGNRRWQSQPLDNGNTYQPTVVGDTLYYRVGGHDLYALSTASGSILWKHTIPALINNDPLPVVNGRIYLVTQHNLNDPPYFLQALSVSSGQPVWSHQLPLSGSAFTWLLVSHDRLYVQSSENGSVRNKLSIVNPATGALLTSYSLPTNSETSILVMVAS